MKKDIVFKLSKDMILVCKGKTNSKQMMIAVGFVSQLYIASMLDEFGIDDAEKLKEMLCVYVDEIAKKIKEKNND